MIIIPILLLIASIGALSYKDTPVEKETTQKERFVKEMK